MIAVELQRAKKITLNYKTLTHKDKITDISGTNLGKKLREIFWH